MSDKKKTYKVKDKNIVKLNNYYKKRMLDEGLVNQTLYIALKLHKKENI